MTVKFAEPRPLNADHNVAGFVCADDSLDEWLRRYALINRAGGSARTFVTRRQVSTGLWWKHAIERPVSMQSRRLAT